MIAPGNLDRGHADPADDCVDGETILEQRGLLFRQDQARRLERSPEALEGPLAGAAGPGEGPDVVHPPDVPDARRGQGSVRIRQHGVGQDGGCIGPDGQPVHACPIDGLEHPKEVPDVVA